jgi:hypothetical protein
MSTRWRAGVTPAVAGHPARRAFERLDGTDGTESTDRTDGTYGTDRNSARLGRSELGRRAGRPATAGRMPALQKQVYLPIFFRIDSISSMTRFILRMVRSSGSEVVMSTPAFFSSSIGYFEPPAERKSR